MREHRLTKTSLCLKAYHTLRRGTGERGQRLVMMERDKTNAANLWHCSLFVERQAQVVLDHKTHAAGP